MKKIFKRRTKLKIDPEYLNALNKEQELLDNDSRDYAANSSEFFDGLKENYIKAYKRVQIIKDGIERSDRMRVYEEVKAELEKKGDPK